MKRSRNLNEVILAGGYFRVMNYKNLYLAPPPSVDYIIQENYLAKTVIVIPVNFYHCETPRFIETPTFTKNLIDIVRCRENDSYDHSWR